MMMPILSDKINLNQGNIFSLLDCKGKFSSERVIAKQPSRKKGSLKNKCISFAKSIALHSLLILLFLIAVHNAHHSYEIKGKKHIIETILVSSASLKTPQIDQKKFNTTTIQQGAIPVKHTTSIVKPQAIIKQQSKIIPQVKPQIKQINGQSLSQLRSIVYRAIAAHKTYPEQAAELDQTGQVMVGFVLQPNGSIIAIKIIHSSGYPILDTAATQAVQQAQPIIGVARYLKQPITMQIPVDFGG